MFNKTFQVTVACTPWGMPKVKAMSQDFLKATESLLFHTVEKSITIKGTMMPKVTVTITDITLKQHEILSDLFTEMVWTKVNGL